MKSVYFGNTKIEYTIIRSKRTTIELIVKSDASVVIRAPFAVSEFVVEKFISEKSDWIMKKQEKMKIHQAEIKKQIQRNYTSGSSILFQGREYPLSIQEDKTLKTVVFHLQEDGLSISLPKYIESDMKVLLERWYRNAAKICFEERTAYYSRFINRPYGTIRIKDQKGCWGSCSSKSNLNFNWRCILAPPEILDYVVVHELCHLIFMNHSKIFWSQVEKILPDYKERMLWLKKNGSLLI